MLVYTTYTSVVQLKLNSSGEYVTYPNTILQNLVVFDFTNLGYVIPLNTPYALQISSYGQGTINGVVEPLIGVMYTKVIRTTGTNGTGGNTGGTIGGGGGGTTV